MKIPIRSGDDHDETAGTPAAAPTSSEIGSDPSATTASTSATPSEVPAEIRVQELEAALVKVTQEYEATREQCLRLMADFDNYRKRTTRQFEEVKQYATTDLVSSLLPGLDNLERAVAAAHQDATPASRQIAEGVSMVMKQFKDALAKVGVRELQVQGEPFDPTRHEAVEVVAVAPSEDGLIVEEVQRGYMVHDRLLRPARVVVGKASREINDGGA
jgi:molecular chaperone GrpE